VIVLLARIRLLQLLQLLLGVLGMLLLLCVVMAMWWVGVWRGVWLPCGGVAHGPCTCCCSTCLVPFVSALLSLLTLGRLLPTTHDTGG
jgi:hypothetical protein